MFCKEDTIDNLRGAEAQYLRACEWEPVPKPAGAEDNPDVPQWWKDPKAKNWEQQEYEQGRAVALQKSRDVR